MIVVLVAIVAVKHAINFKHVAVGIRTFND